MMVVPESMMVWMPVLGVAEPTTVWPPVACQKPLLETVWYSIEPV